jgi:hypothetical protein
MKLRRWLPVIFLVGGGVGMWSILPPSPPDFSNQGFVSVHAHLHGNADKYSPEEQVQLAGAMTIVPPADGSSADPTVVGELAEVLRSGRSVLVCRCAALGSLEFRRADGTAEQVLVMPAHDEGSVEFRFGMGRFRVSREWFLKVISPLGVPAARWYSWCPEGAKSNWPLDLVNTSPAEIETLSATRFRCRGVECQLLGLAESNDPAVRERALEFAKQWFKHIGNQIGIYNRDHPLQADDGTCIVWLRGYDDTLSCLNLELVKAGLVEVEYSLWKDYGFTEQTKSGKEWTDWQAKLQKAKDQHQKDKK